MIISIALYKYMRFIKTCNEAISSLSDFAIVRETMGHVRDIQSVSIERIAQDANISIPSVSRLIRRIGFSSFKEFKTVLSEGSRETAMRYAVRWQGRFGRSDGSTASIMSQAHQEALTHMQATLDVMDPDSIDRAVDLLHKSRSVFLLGDSLELDMLYVLQTMLMNDGIAAYAFDDNSVRETQAQAMGEDDTLLFVNVSRDWIQDWQLKILETVADRGCHVIVFSQEDISDRVRAEVACRYGIPDSYENAYYSVFLVTDILSAAYEARSAMTF